MKKFDLKKTVAKAKSLDYKKLARDFVYGKPAGERRLGDLHMTRPARISTGSGAASRTRSMTSMNGHVCGACCSCPSPRT